MKNEEKRIQTLSAGFKTLEEEEKSYILGVSRALAFAAEASKPRKPAKRGPDPFDPVVRHMTGEEAGA